MPMRKRIMVSGERLLLIDWLVGVIVVMLSVLVLFGTAHAQQRVIVEKATGNIVDFGDETLQYDSRYFDNMDLPNNPIPAGADVRKYTRNAAGAIVLRPKAELVANFPDEWRDDLIARINASALASNVKALLIDIVKTVR